MRKPRFNRQAPTRHPARQVVLRAALDQVAEAWQLLESGQVNAAEWHLDRAKLLLAERRKRNPDLVALGLEVRP